VIAQYINGAWRQIGTAGSGTSSYAVTGLNANTGYSFKVGAYNSAGTAWSTTQSATTLGITAPSAPSLKATAVSTSQINLSWVSVSTPTAPINGYVIAQYINGAWRQIGTLSSSTSSCAVTKLSRDTTYYFAVGAYNSAGISWSAYQSAHTFALNRLTPAPAAGATVAANINSSAPSAGSLASLGAGSPSALLPAAGLQGLSKANLDGLFAKWSGESLS
jgi:hypothetical protein